MPHITRPNGQYSTRMVIVSRGIGMMETMKSATAWLMMRVAKLERSFFSYLYESRTRKFETALTAAKMRRMVDTMITEALMWPPADGLETDGETARNM